MRSIRWQLVPSPLAGWLVGVLAVACVCTVWAAPAVAVAPAAGWTIHSSATPTNFSTAQNTKCLETIKAGGFGEKTGVCDTYEVLVRNAGALATNGGTVTLTDALPAGVTAQAVEFLWSGLPFEDGGKDENLVKFGFCPTLSPVRCELPTGEDGLPPVAPGDTLRIRVYVTVNVGAEEGLVNTAAVSGGGTSEVSTSAGNQVASAAPMFGVADLSSPVTGVNGMPDSQAGSHPYTYTARIDLNSEFRYDPEGNYVATSVQDVRDVVLDLPVGFLGSALATPTCTLAQLSKEAARPPYSFFVGGCPSDTQVGFLDTEPDGTTSVSAPIYNMVTERGVAAEFGFVDGLDASHVLYANVVPTPAGYVLRTTSRELPQIELKSLEATFYGNPVERDGSGNTPEGMFTNSSDCSGEPLVSTVHVDSWQNPGSYNADGTPNFNDPAWASATTTMPAVTGCNELQFDPSLTAQPETMSADSPTGLDVDIKVPQSEQPETLATPPLRNASVMLPEGLTLNPAAANGLGSCSEAQIGLGGAGAPTCPESSKIGSVEVVSPLTAGTLVGSIYLATQNENPFHSLLAGYIVVDDPTTGVIIKIPGDLTPNPSTGQITGVFDDNPQLPFGDLHLHFFGGARGELATPQGCGTFTVASDLSPWSAPDSGPDATPSNSFQVNSGCTSGFAPAFTAGSESPQAGGYSPFTLSLSRNDGEQGLSGVSVSLPQGLLGKLAGIPLCPDAQANNGTCPEASEVGTVTTGAGVGPDPLFVSGKAYLTGPYNGGPYGLVVEVPAVAGPFNLGTVVVRQSLRIDPTTAQVTDVSDPFPAIIDGIPLRIRSVNVTLDRPGFTFNPTSCTPTAVTGTVTSTQGTSANVSSRFQAGGCRELPFAPRFTVSTQAATSKHNGASLIVKGVFPTGDANIHSVAVTLPKQLPARLTTIQQACTQAVFAANPAGCPAGSDIGTASASTPILAVPVTGPVYLVSHGGAAFPDIVAILQGAGVTIDLTGSIDIKHNITSSTFASVPDAPITTFQLSLPEGPHSGLAAVVPAKAKGNLCGQALTMPFTITAQNGAIVKQPVKIAVTGCAKAKAKKKPKAKHTKPKKKK